MDEVMNERINRLSKKCLKPALGRYTSISVFIEQKAANSREQTPLFN